ncbi:MAG TPA: hypothetical protein VGH90_00195 [Chthoniobacteraceae bacterium]
MYLSSYSKRLGGEWASRVFFEYEYEDEYEDEDEDEDEDEPATDLPERADTAQSPDFRRT